MKIVVTGGKGQLASEIKRIYSTGMAEIGKCPVENANIEFIDVDELDITDIKAVREYFNSKDTDITVEDIHYTPSGSSFTVVYKGERIAMETKLLGELNILNILSAIAVAKHLGVTWSVIQRAVKQMKQV